MMQLIVGLKIDKYKSLAECVKIVRKYHNYKISELKERIDNHDYVLCYSCTDDEGVKNIIKCYNELTANDADISLYELDHRPTTIELIRNRDRMYDEISQEIDMEDEASI